MREKNGSADVARIVSSCSTMLLTRRHSASPVSTFIRLRYGRYPKLRDALLRRHEVYNAQCEDVARLEAEGRVFVIRPESPLGIRRMERELARLQAVYDRGTADGMRTLAAVRAYLA